MDGITAWVWTLWEMDGLLACFRKHRSGMDALQRARLLEQWMGRGHTWTFFKPWKVKMLRKLKTLESLNPQSTGRLKRVVACRCISLIGIVRIWQRFRSRSGVAFRV